MVRWKNERYAAAHTLSEPNYVPQGLVVSNSLLRTRAHQVCVLMKFAHRLRSVAVISLALFVVCGLSNVPADENVQMRKELSSASEEHAFPTGDADNQLSYLLPWGSSYLYGGPAVHSLPSAMESLDNSTQLLSSTKFEETNPPYALYPRLQYPFLVLRDLREVNASNVHDINMQRKLDIHEHWHDLSHPPTYRLETVGFACVNGSKSGILTPSKGLMDLRNVLNSVFHIRNHPSMLYPLEANVTGSTVMTLPGPTILVNCFSKETDKHLAHLFEGGNRLVHLAIAQRAHKKARGTPLLLPRFRSVIFHQCPNPYITNWPSGIKLYEEMLFVWKQVITTADAQVVWAERFMCSNELWYSNTHSVNVPWPTGPTWNEYIRTRLKVSQHENRLCQVDRKIVVFQRTGGINPTRDFSNRVEVVDILSTFSTRKVEIITTTEKMSLEQQAEVFSDFDIIVSPHGSHLTNLMFSKPGSLAVEVKTVLHNDDNRRMAESSGMFYIRSMAHHNGDKQDINSNVDVNTSELAHELDLVLEEVCKKKRSD